MGQRSLSDRVIASATGARPSTVLNGRSAPTGSRADRLIELAEMTDRLARVMDPGHIAVWLNRPLQVLDDDSTCSRGARARLARVLDRPRQGVVGDLLPAGRGWHEVRPRELLDLGDRVGLVVLGVGALDLRGHEVVV